MPTPFAWRFRHPLVLVMFMPGVAFALVMFMPGFALRVTPLVHCQMFGSTTLDHRHKLRPAPFVLRPPPLVHR
jgi:hypothetical protein